MATNTPVTGSSDSSPVTVLRNRMPLTLGSPSMAVTAVLVRMVILSLAWARSSMIREARNSSRRWMSVTLRANRVRKVASSMAESPPPTTAMSWSRKKKPSQVAQVLTPMPSRVSSPGTPRWRAAAPMARITERA